jgi:hypothetical protein
MRTGSKTTLGAVVAFVGCSSATFRFRQRRFCDGLPRNRHGHHPVFGWDNALHAMDGPAAFGLTKNFLMGIATSSNLSLVERNVALIMGEHLTQDSDAHYNIYSMLEHVIAYGVGDDENPQDKARAADDTWKFLTQFRHKLVDHLGEQGAEDTLLSMASIATDPSVKEIHKFVDELTNSINAMIEAIDGSQSLLPGEPSGTQQDEFGPIENLDNYGSCLFNGGGACN